MSSLFQARASVLEYEAKQRLVEKEIELERLKSQQHLAAERERIIAAASEACRAFGKTGAVVMAGIRSTRAMQNEPTGQRSDLREGLSHPGDEALKLQDCMSNCELQEAITMANSMVKATGQGSPTYLSLRAHLEKLLHIQQARAAGVSCGA